jgi:hypothetical protein
MPQADYARTRRAAEQEAVVCVRGPHLPKEGGHEGDMKVDAQYAVARGTSRLKPARFNAVRAYRPK